MKLLIQRVACAKVTVDKQVAGEIGRGLLLFLGIHRKDDAAKIPWFIEKVIHLRIFKDQEEKMNLSLKDVEGEILLISQFTLYADCQTGRRPSFTETMPPKEAEALYETVLLKLKEALGEKRVASGQFGANMQVELINDGPVTILLDK